MPDSCQKIENGWKCTSTTIGKEYEKIEKICKAKGNIFYCEGPCDDYVFCFMPFDDAGKECINSSQCKGSCIGDYDKIINKYDSAQTPGSATKCNADDICSGTCSKIPKIGSCDWYFEVNDGFYIFHGGGWC